LIRTSKVCDDWNFFAARRADLDASELSTGRAEAFHYCNAAIVLIRLAREISRKHQPHATVAHLEPKDRRYGLLADW
jgi:hypothetical protein